MDKYLVTGGAGFIGSNLVESLVLQKNEVIVVDDLSMGKYSNISEFIDSGVTFYHKSITDFSFMQELLKKEKFNYIVLLGAVASVADSVARPLETHEINLEANLNIFETVRKFEIPVKKILFASSAAVYGNNPELPKKETSVIDPLTPYAVDKFASERYAISYGKLYGLPTVATRFFNVYGPKQNPESPYSGVLSIIHNCLLNDSKFTVFGDGEQTRDFTYVKDVIKALMLLLHDERALHDVYNVATGKWTTLNDDIHAFEKAMDKKIDVEYLPARTGDIKESYADITKLSLLGYHAEFSINEGLREYVESEDD
ncbi:GDP-mannose 4,6-dehydratase [Ligilactobacillus acidipiscis]|uniref:GDP-mannose 4,6-dehydratase n=1 Tax=Ligilactobacillus acidipiscis TaxID=89059 RepID=UPI0023F8E3CC|nr:GDP-mannose 4,6-dehydratase [Ligilactobacillus acidipiscis]WEV56548.1 GDP-mannose 4,6-dehydratase [Ligilactobacillus acidipiscis]